MVMKLESKREDSVSADEKVTNGSGTAVELSDCCQIDVVSLSLCGCTASVRDSRIKAGEEKKSSLNSRCANNTDVS